MSDQQGRAEGADVTDGGSRRSAGSESGSALGVQSAAASAAAAVAAPAKRLSEHVARRTAEQREAIAERATRTAEARRTPGKAAKSGKTRTRTAKLRLVHVDPWSVMKTAFLLSIVIGIVCVIAVAVVWGVLSVSGVWDSVNSFIRTTVGSDSSSKFDITNYIGTSRMVGFTMLVSVVNVVLLTVIATLGAFVYNLAATLLGGVELTFAEDR